ncbi:MAG: Gfo/Idh/MocA family oxidoreductase [Planctomycetes bacterium]|nr:Gfo/Idh/MocA family oxidoreductase [Planctomycetota bacterium]
MDQVRTGVIGLGMGQAHLRGYENAPNAKTVAVCDIDENRLEEVVGNCDEIQKFTDTTEMLNLPELDAVSIALPNYLHAPITIEALKAGKHVLCEKPMAMNSAEAMEMKETAEEAGLKLMLHFNMRFMNTAATLKPLLSSGSLGTIYHATTTYTRQNGYPKPGGWFGQKDKSGGGPMIDLGVHRLDLALWLMDYPRPVSVLGGVYDHLAQRKLADADFDCEDFSTGMIRFENGATLYLTASWDGYQPESTEITMALYGTEGSAFERSGTLTYCHEKDGEAISQGLEQRDPDESPQEHFVRSILEDIPPGPCAEHGVIVMKILDAIYESARTGHEVSIA